MAESTGQEPVEHDMVAQEIGDVEMAAEYYSRYIPAPDFVEDLEMYTPGGFHPVDLKDRFQDRYTVIHKLGAGGSSTVWLAHDEQEKRYVALKIVTSDMSEYAQTEVAVHRRLQVQIDAETLKMFLVPLLDDFWIDGPNGRHLCLVQGVCGPSLASFRQARDTKIRPDLGPVLGRQLASALQCLHETGFVFGDLSSGNVAFALSKLDDYSVEELIELLGQPVGCPVTPARESDVEWAKIHAPPTVYDNIDFTDASRLHLLRPEAHLIDLGGAYFLPKETDQEGIQLTESYADAECLYHGSDTDQSSDIWALACIIFELRSSKCLFENQGMGVWAQIVTRLGPAPKALTGEDGDEDVEETNQDAMAVDEGEDAPNAMAVDEAEDAPKEKELQHQSKRESLMLVVNNLTSLRKLKSIYKRIVTMLAFKKPTASPKSETQASAPQTSASQSTEIQSAEPEQSEPQPQSPDSEWDWDGKDPTLQGQINNIGNWHQWHRLTIEQRRERLSAWNTVFGDNIDVSDPGLDRGPPPHGKLSQEEAKDLGDLLAKMLTWVRKERMSLSEVLEHPWLNKEYVNDNKGEWLQWYFPGGGYSSNGVVFI